MNRKDIINSITFSESDKHLFEWGYNLLDEGIELIEQAEFIKSEPVYDFATGSGRFVALLTRMNFDVITGDITAEQREDAIKRISEDYLNKVKFILLNLEKTSFKENSLINVETVNTIHHLDDPIICIKELIRIHSPKGKLLIADFNNEGFDQMDKIHKIKYGELHTRGNISWEQIEELVRISYKKIKIVKTPLNHGIVAESKK